MRIRPELGLSRPARQLMVVVFSGAVRTQQPKNLPRRSREADLVDGNQIAEFLVQAFDFDHGQGPNLANGCRTRRRYLSSIRPIPGNLAIIRHATTVHTPPPQRACERGGGPGRGLQLRSPQTSDLHNTACPFRRFRRVIHSLFPATARQSGFQSAAGQPPDSR